MEGQWSRVILQITLVVFSLHFQTGSAASATLALTQASQQTISYCPPEDQAVVGITATITREETEKDKNISDFKVGYQTLLADHVEPGGEHNTNNLTDVFTFNMNISEGKNEVHCSYILGIGDTKTCDNSLTVTIDNSTCKTTGAPTTTVPTTASTTVPSTDAATTQALTTAPPTTEATTTTTPTTTNARTTTKGIGPGRPNQGTPKPEPKDNTKLFVVFFAAGAVILVGVLAYCYLCAVTGRNTADRLVQLQPEHRAAPGPTPSTTIITVPEPVYIETPVFVEAPQPMYEEPYYGPPGPGFDAPLPPGFAAPPPPGFGGPQPPPFYPTHQDGSVLSDRGSMQMYQYPAPDGSVRDREGSVTSDRSYGSRQSYSRRH